MTLIGRLFGWKRGSGEGDSSEPSATPTEDQEALTVTSGAKPGEDITRSRRAYNRRVTALAPVAIEWRPPSSEKADAIQRQSDHRRSEPVALFALSRGEGAAEKIFEGLHLHYIECLLSGRLDIWAKAAHAAVDLLASPTTKIHKRVS